MDVLSQLQWRPTIGDPGLIGWMTVAAYAIAAVLAASAGRAAMVRHRESGTGRPDALLWLTVALAMGFLCLNKQLDLQTLVTDIGRAIARNQGWYERRRWVQEWFVLGVLIGAGTVWSLLLWRYRTFTGSHKLLVTGALLLVTFVAVRAISIHHVDMFLNTRVFGFKANWALELTGIVLIGVAAARERVRR